MRVSNNLPLPGGEEVLSKTLSSGLGRIQRGCNLDRHQLDLSGCAVGAFSRLGRLGDMPHFSYHRYNFREKIFLVLAANSDFFICDKKKKFKSMFGIGTKRQKYLAWITDFKRGAENSKPRYAREFQV